MLLCGAGGGSRGCFSSQVSTFHVVQGELSQFPRTQAACLGPGASFLGA